MIVVYSKPACVQCDFTKKMLKRRGIQYDEYDVSVDPEAARRVREMGYKSLPVVVVRADKHWSGFRADLIDKL